MRDPLSVLTAHVDRTPTTLSTRLPEDMRNTATSLDPRLTGFTLLYRTDVDGQQSFQTELPSGGAARGRRRSSGFLARRA